MRALASIQVITSLSSIPNADKIEVASILGWKVVVRKGEFHVGDKCVYFEVDSVLPPLPSLSFLPPRLRTVTLRGQLSQGLAMPLSIIEEAGYTIDGDSVLLPSGNKFVLAEGEDLTTALGVLKYEEEPVKLGKGVTGYSFPSGYVHHTDLIRIQNKPQLLHEFQGRRVYGLQKIDGYSFTAIYDVVDDKLLIASSDTLIVKDDSSASNIYWDIAQQHKLLSKMKWYHQISAADAKSIAIQCELAGPGIRKNRMGLAEKELFLFNVAVIDTSLRYLDYPELVEAANLMGLTMPELVFLDAFSFETIDDVLEFATKNTYPNGYPQEGVVFKPCKETYSETLCGRLQVKAINNNYLLKTGA